jgi:hypothetical protein
MPRQQLLRPYAAVGIAIALVGAMVLSARARAEPDSGQDDDNDNYRVSLAVAQDRAKTMHDIYAATLEALHHHYFHGDRARVPAKAMEDVFAELQQQTKMEARWISASLQPMSLNHAPKTDFETKAAKEIAAGKAEFAAVEGGYYRRAGSISLSGGCVACHGGLFQGEGRRQFAGLVISIPITSDTQPASECR